MAQVYNFSSGPAMLPAEVLKLAQQELCDWHGLGYVGHGNQSPW